MFRHCINRTRCQPWNPSPDTSPPSIPVPMTTEEQMWKKVKARPLVPFGCLVTVYFLASGILSCQRRDSSTSQRMMRYRVMAQFVTILAFIGDMGIENVNFRLPPVARVLPPATTGNKR